MSPRSPVIDSTTIPQTVNMRWVREVIRAVGQGCRNKASVIGRTSASERHAYYTIHTTISLGFIREGLRGFELTARGVQFESAVPGSREESDLIAAGLQSSEVVHAIAPDLMTDNPPGLNAIAEQIVRLAGLKRETARRRAQSLIGLRLRARSHRTPLFDGYDSPPSTALARPPSFADEPSPAIPFPISPPGQLGSPSYRAEENPMFRLHEQKRPEEVFTPRAHVVNPRMYVERPDIEQSLTFALRGSMHIVLHGSSGCGKSWLYKRVLGRLKVPFQVANLANASRLGSIASALQELMDGENTPRETGYTQTKTAQVSIPIASGGLTHQGQYVVPTSESFRGCLKWMRAQYGDDRACIVFDNLEAIIQRPDLMRELGDIITLLDDERYQKFGVKLVVVGVPSDVREYFRRVENRETISNRLYEVAEVGRLQPNKVAQLVENGFVNELRMDVRTPILRELVQHVNWITNGIPQRVHEYCQTLAYIGEEDGRRIERSMFERADRHWLQQAFSNCYQAVKASMNERQTGVQRRNQVLFALGHVASDVFRSSNVESLVRHHFRASTDQKRLNVSGILTALSKEAVPVIQRCHSRGSFEFTDPRFRLCIRTMLRRNPDDDSLVCVALHQS